MSTILLIATEQGLMVGEHAAGEWSAGARTLDRTRVTSVIAREGVILAGTPEGVLRSDDRGKTWRAASQGLTTRYVRWLAYHPDISDCEFAGTEPADIFISRDGAQTWRECSEVARLRDAHHWFLPYSQGAGCIRGFAFHGARAYAAAEVGGALRSDDTGASWALCAGSDGNPDLEGPPAPLIYPDVHSIETHPASSDAVAAATGGGFYLSKDGGATWMLAYDCYVRALWWDPQDMNHLLLGPADGVERNGRIEESRDGGTTWTLASDGVAAPWARHLVERFTRVDNELAAVLSNGEILASPLGAWRWRRALPAIKNANAVTTMVE